MFEYSIIDQNELKWIYFITKNAYVYKIIYSFLKELHT